MAGARVVIPRRIAYRAAWAAILASLALAIAAGRGVPASADPAANAAAARCAAILHGRGITPAPGACR
jgi:hypothetical protein